MTCKNRPRNDLQCVEWDVKPLHYYYFSKSAAVQKNMMCYSCCMLTAEKSITDDPNSGNPVMFAGGLPSIERHACLLDMFAGVGKSCILQRFAGEVFSGKFSIFLGYRLSRKTIYFKFIYVQSI